MQSLVETAFSPRTSLGVIQRDGNADLTNRFYKLDKYVHDLIAPSNYMVERNSPKVTASCASGTGLDPSSAESLKAFATSYFFDIVNQSVDVGSNPYRNYYGWNPIVLDYASLLNPRQDGRWSCTDVAIWTNSSCARIGARPYHLARHEIPVPNAQNIDTLPAEAQDVLNELERLTGWSRRRLTDLVDTSHATLNRIAALGHEPRVALRSQLEQVLLCVRRLSRLCGGDQRALDRALLQRDVVSGLNAANLMRAGDVAAGLGTAMRVLRPRRGLNAVIQPPRYYDDRPSTSVYGD